MIVRCAALEAAVVWFVACAMFGSQLAACVGPWSLNADDGGAAGNDGRGHPSDAAGAPDDAVPTCPRDPDCFSGDCFECPEFWVCETLASEISGNALKRCTNPGADLPDDQGGWACQDANGQTECRRAGDVLPDGAGDDDWTCERQAEFVVCAKPADYPDEGGSTAWTCEYASEFVRVCEDETPPGDFPDVPAWACPAAAPDEPNPVCPTICRDNGWVRARFEGDDGVTTDGPGPQLLVFSEEGRDRECVNVFVEVSGWYAAYDTLIAESCHTQLDETGFVTISNPCNPAGTPREGNVGDLLVVDDVDNTNACETDAQCADGLVCRMGRRVQFQCCVPEEPASMGQFWLQAGVPNELCLNHWCPEWKRRGRVDGHVSSLGCDHPPNSIHLLFDGAFFCPDPTLPDLCPGS